MGKTKKNGRGIMSFGEYHCPAVQLREDLLGQGQGLEWAWKVAGGRAHAEGRISLKRRII